jgi:hypothetical protein
MGLDEMGWDGMGWDWMREEDSSSYGGGRRTRREEFAGWMKTAAATKGVEEVRRTRERWGLTAREKRAARMERGISCYGEEGRRTRREEVA